MATKTWTAVEYDGAKALKSQASRLQRIELPRTLDLKVVLELDEELYKDLSNNPTWLQKLQSKAMDEADDAVKEAAKLLQEADKDATEDDAKAAEARTREVQKKLESMFKDASDDMAKVAGRLVEDYVKADKALTKYKRKCVGKIAVTALTVSAGAAATVLSGGTISPVGWVSVVRGCMTALKELDKLWSDVEGTGAAIRKELSLLDKWLADKIDVETKAGKLEKGAREVGLNLLSKTLNVNVPSMKTCEEHIALHEKNITKLERKSKDVSEGIYAAMDAQEKWAKEFDKAKRDQPAPAVGKVKTELDKAEKSLDDILKKAVSLNERIAAAQKEHEAFEKAYTALEEGLPNWSKYVDSALSLAVDIGSGIQDASKAVEKGLAVVSALAQTAADEKLTARK